MSKNPPFSILFAKNVAIYALFHFFKNWESRAKHLTNFTSSLDRGGRGGGMKKGLIEFESSLVGLAWTANKNRQWFAAFMMK